jgi:hypothetical protein
MQKVFLLALFTLLTNVIKAQLSDFTLYPNPFQGDVTIKVKSDKFYKADYTLEIFDITGRLRIDQNGELIFGQNEILMNTDNLNTGLYLFKVISEGDTLIRKGIKQVVLGVSNLPEELEVKSYPNPVLDELVIEGLPNQSSIKIEVFNVLGQVVYSSKSVQTETKTINLINLNPAIYFLMITDDYGSVIYRKEFQKL